MTGLGALGGENWRETYRRKHRSAAQWITRERPDHTADIRMITAPTLLIWGDRDPDHPYCSGPPSRVAAATCHVHLDPRQDSRPGGPTSSGGRTARRSTPAMTQRVALGVHR